MKRIRTFVHNPVWLLHGGIELLKCAQIESTSVQIESLKYWTSPSSYIQFYTLTFTFVAPSSFHLYWINMYQNMCIYNHERYIGILCVCFSSKRLTIALWHYRVKSTHHTGSRRFRHKFIFLNGLWRNKIEIFNLIV